jgi:hypothetical protein
LTLDLVKGIDWVLALWIQLNDKIFQIPLLYKVVLEYWMQNGRAALSLVPHNIKKEPTEKVFRKLLYSLYRTNGRSTKLSFFLFYPIYNQVEERNRKGFAEFFHKTLTRKENTQLSCTYCGHEGANEMASYVFPFITKREKYPNTYSWGEIRSLNFCSRCMLTSFAANNRLLFVANSPTRKSDQISTVLFFSANDNELAKFYSNFIEATLAPAYYTNMRILERVRRRPPEYDMAYYPEELLAVLIDYISNKIHDLRQLGKQLGAIVFSCNRVSSGVSGTTIYDSFDIIDDLNPFIRGFYRFKKNANNKDAFKIFFRNLRTMVVKRHNIGSPHIYSINQQNFVKRRQLFRHLLAYRRWDWETIESLVMLKASENNAIPYLKSFISVIMDELSLSERDVFGDANRTGYNLGKTMKEKERNLKRLKKFLFDFRRCRHSPEFLSLLNLVQAQAEIILYNTDGFVSPEQFDMAKVGFLIGYSNAIFTK